jgi:hypothetical protein
MAVRTISGTIAKFSVSDNGLYVYVGSDPDTVSVSKAAANYNGIASAVFVAAANNFRVDVKTDTDGRSIALLTVDC